VKIWDSESGEVGDVSEDRCHVRLDDENGILILANDDLGQRTIALGFLGPKAEDNAKKWQAWFKEHDDAEGDFHCAVCTETTKHILDCFKG
jgi:hypothetical protein